MAAFVNGATAFRRARAAAATTTTSVRKSSTLTTGRRNAVRWTCLGPTTPRTGGRGRMNPSPNPNNRTGGASTVLERPTKVDTEKAKVDPGKRYKVIVFNEVTQTRSFIVQAVIKCLPGVDETAAKAIADRVKKVGQAVVGTWIFEMAEAYCESLRSSGLKADIEID